MLQVGSAGDVGTVQLQDLLFTGVGATAGAILVEWNVAASSPGAAGMWDVGPLILFETSFLRLNQQPFLQLQLLTSQLVTVSF